MKNGDKSGQFYLIAALVIITLIIGLVAVYNYSRTGEKSRIYALSDELKVESGKILDYGAVMGSYPWNDFTKNFTDYIGGDIEITYITGTLLSHNVFYYDVNGQQQTATSYFFDPTLTVTHKNNNYSFDLKEGENFYFIISQNISGEYYVTKG